MGATMVRFIHSADWQIGMTRHFLSPEAQSRYSEARLEAIRRIAELAARESCDFVVVAGDVFESNLLDRQVVVRALDALATVEVPVFLLPGNHDPLLSAGSLWDSPSFLGRCPPQVVVLRDDRPVAVPGCAAEVVGAVWPTKRPVEDLVARALSRLEPIESARILVGHGAIDEQSPDAGNLSLISLARADQAIRDGLVQYIALGDRHSVTEVGSTGRIWYSGTPLVTDYDEVAPNRILLVSLDVEECSVEQLEVGDWTFRQHRFDLDDDVAGVDRWLEELPDKRRCVVKASFVGTLSLGAKVRLDQLLDEHRDLLAALEVWDRHTDLAVMPSEEEIGDPGFGGFVETTLEELKDLAGAGDDKAGTAQDALSLLFRLAGGGS